MAKTQRRNCDNSKCKKLYHYSSAASKYCSRKCQDVVYRARKAEREKADRQAEIDGWMKAVQARPTAAPQIAPPNGQPKKPPPAPASNPADECECIGKDFGHLPNCHLNTDPARQQARPTVKITIRNVPTRFPGTPLPRVR